MCVRRKSPKVSQSVSHFCGTRTTAMNQTFIVTGMTCGHCEKAVTRAIQQVDPQAEVKIDRSNNLVHVQSQQPRESLIRAISEEGYAVTP